MKVADLHFVADKFAREWTSEMAEKNIVRATFSLKHNGVRETMQGLLGAWGQCQGILTKGGGLSKVDLLIKVAF